MDPNMELLLAKAAPPIRWEDEEKATNDVEQLREEFRRRLYGNGEADGTAKERKDSSGSGSQESAAASHRP
jgi:hypothetical protein